MLRRSFLAGLALSAMAGRVGATATPLAKVSAAKITLLSTMLSDGDELGEWGFSALIEVGGKSYLFDTGANPDLVLHNAWALKIDLSPVEDVIISHNHDDHTGGLISLRRELMTTNPRAMSRAHVSAGIFTPRWGKDGADHNGLTPLKAQYEAMGGSFIVHDGLSELMPGVWFTGPVPRPHDETNWQPGLTMDSPKGRIQDNVPEDGALIMVTNQGSIILTGCGHAGIVNIGDDAQKLTNGAPVLAVIGGLHLFAKSDAIVDWTGAQLKRMGVKYLLAAHCTGIEATFRLRHDLGLTRHTAVVGGDQRLLQPGRRDRTRQDRRPIEQAAANSCSPVWVLRQRPRHGGISAIRQT